MTPREDVINTTMAYITKKINDPNIALYILYYIMNRLHFYH